MIKTIALIISIFISAFNCHGQESNKYPLGFTIDTKIKDVAKKDKSLNKFKIQNYVNDTIDVAAKPMLEMIMAFGFTPIFINNKTDTLINFMNAMAFSGLQIYFKKDSIYAETYVSSKNCKCFKSDSLQKNVSYGAGYRPLSQIIVFNKKPTFTKGEKIYGYLKTSGGYLFQENQTSFDKLRYDFEGYFEITFDGFLGEYKK